jgi:hypothetical protein
MSPQTPDIRPYLEIRTASPTGWSMDGRKLLISSDLPGTAQVHRLDLEGADLPVAAGDLRQLTGFIEPIGAGYLPTGRGTIGCCSRPTAGATSVTSCSPPATILPTPTAGRTTSSRWWWTTTSSTVPAV